MANIIRGTTQGFRFNMPVNVSEITDLSVTFSQRGSVVLKKKLVSCTSSGKTLILKLSQTDTLSLVAGHNLEIQIKAKINNEVVASRIFTIGADRILDEEVL